MREFHTAEIIAVGTELLTPHRADTNSLFITGRLNDIGIAVRAKAIVGDAIDDISAMLRQALGRADVVIVTGGLGPTADDLTREAVADALRIDLHEDPAIIAAIENRFRARGIRMPEINRRQAQVPAGATPLDNPNGSAPGLWIDVNQQAVVLLPGPPREMRPMFETAVVSRLRRAGQREVRRRVIKITGRPESSVDEIAEPIYSRFRSAHVPIDTTILASPGQIELHLSSTGDDRVAIDEALDRGVAELAAALAPFVFSTDGRSLEEVVGALLIERGLQIAAAESCTGGLVLARLTDVPGSSAYVRGGVVAYADDVKIASLGVDAELLRTYGAVSEPVAVAMAEGVRERLSAEIGVGVTGIAGPGGGSPAKPVGTVVIAVAGIDPTVKTFHFPGDRYTNRQHSCAAALDMVRRCLLPR